MNFFCDYYIKTTWLQRLERNEDRISMFFGAIVWGMFLGMAVGTILFK